MITEAQLSAAPDQPGHLPLALPRRALDVLRARTPAPVTVPARLVADVEYDPSIRALAEWLRIPSLGIAAKVHAIRGEQDLWITCSVAASP